MSYIYPEKGTFAHEKAKIKIEKDKRFSGTFTCAWNSCKTWWSILLRNRELVFKKLQNRDNIYFL